VLLLNSLLLYLVYSGISVFLAPCRSFPVVSPFDIFKAYILYIAIKSESQNFIRRKSNIIDVTQYTHA